MKNPFSQATKTWHVRVLDENSAPIKRVYFKGAIGVPFTDLERAKLAAVEELFDYRLTMGVRSDCSLGDWVEGISNTRGDNIMTSAHDTWTLWDRLTNLKYYIYTRR